LVIERRKNGHSFLVHLGSILVSIVALRSCNSLIGLRNDCDQEVEEQDNHQDDVSEPEGPQEIDDNLALAKEWVWILRIPVFLNVIKPSLVLWRLEITDRVSEGKNEHLNELVESIIFRFIELQHEYSVLNSEEHYPKSEESHERSHVKNREADHLYKETVI